MKSEVVVIKDKKVLDEFLYKLRKTAPDIPYSVDKMGTGNFVEIILEQNTEKLDLQRR